MNSPFSFDIPLLFGFLSVLLLVGALVRATVPWVQRYLFPSCLIGGAAGFVLVSTGLVEISHTGLETLAYHCFNLSFISIGLTGPSSTSQSREKSGLLWKGSLWMALTQGVTFPLQALVGGIAVITLGAAGIDLFDTFGFLAPLGFNEGPGQALSFGKVWEGLGFEYAASIGLTFAAIGYGFAFFVGVPLANQGMRKDSKGTGRPVFSSDIVRGIIDSAGPVESAGRLRLQTGNIDSLAFQAAMAGLVYMVTYGAIDFLAGIVGTDTAGMLWGFFFFFGLAVAIAVRRILGILRIDHLMDRGIQNRITGWSIDFLIVATIPAIQLTVVRQFFLPVAVIALVNGLATTGAVILLGRRLGSLKLERTVAIYGTVTGTVSCGLLLLRMVDPDFRTPVAMELALMNIAVLPILVTCLTLVNAPVWWNWSLSLTLACFAAIALCSAAAIFFGYRAWKKPMSPMP